MYLKVFSLFVVCLIQDVISAPSLGNITDTHTALQFDENGEPFVDLGKHFLD